ncbi:hypothetical protein JCM3775_005411 [Rhodotorula graminis]|uniref:Zinc/iron permease n=1 Tax=Rhodotorula graminis (strain WP1) TaxID=578459 RepID=A0A194S3Y1_RHOGW|nr:uncharacterized protein RHOBADRAFT_43718 [Rhodotorula graminis WP1]KPV75229.1 hypothetical protein RHOBADRAFT_43718 [Rhodotorula graminis WP1]
MGFARLLALATGMAVATLLAAFAPLVVHLSPTTLTSVSELSVGILVGAALSIILPEGVAAVFENSSHDDGDHDDNAAWIGGALLSGFLLMYLLDNLHGHDEYPDPNPQPHLHPRHHHRPNLSATPSHQPLLEPLRTSDEYPRRDVGGNGHGSEHWRSDEEGGAASTSTSRSRSPMPCNDAHLITADASSVSTVVGMLTHSLADGISLGASSLPLAAAAATAAAAGDAPSSSSPLQLVIFVAILLHKAPTAFALSSLLLSSPATSRAFTRRALVLFSLAAPLGAVATYALLSLVGAHGGTGSAAGWWTGLALVFSGGTFLFVATHAVREQEKRAEGHGGGGGGGGHGHAHGADGGEGAEGRIGDKQRLALVLTGMVAPALLSRLVGHGH